MSSIGDSLRVKRAGEKAPAVVGAPPVATPDMPLQEGKSGGISKSKSVKNAGSTPAKQGGANMQSFVERLGVPTSSDKTLSAF